MHSPLYIYLGIMNAMGFAFMLIDKYKAKHGLWRIRERTLLLTALLGGSLGSLLGMQLVRHKTKHPQFAVGIPFMLAFHCVILYALSARGVIG